MKIDLTHFYDFFEPIYHPIIEDRNRFIVMMGGAGSGKSFAAAYKVIYRLLTEPGITIAIVRKTQRSIRQSCYTLLSNVISELGLDSIFNKCKSDMSIECQNGSRVISIGCDDVEKIKSIVADSFFIEEATELNKQDFEQLNLRLRGTEYYKQIILAFNPISHYSWLKKYFFDRTNFDNITIIKTTYKDNPYLDDDYKKELENLAKTNKNMHKIYTLGEWGQNEEGLIYPNIKYGKIDPENIQRTIFGMDFGFTAPTAIVRLDFDFDDNVYLQEILYRTHMADNDIVSFMNSIDMSKFDYIYCDNASPDRIAALKQAGYNAVKCRKGNVEQGINIVRTYNLFTNESNKNINRELSSYSYIQKDGEYVDKAERINDHTMDAIRYALISSLYYQVDTSIKQSDIFSRRT